MEIVLGMTVVMAGFGPIHLAQPDLISSVNIVSIILIAVHLHPFSLSDTPEDIRMYLRAFLILYGLWVENNVKYTKLYKFECKS